MKMRTGVLALMASVSLAAAPLTSVQKAAAEARKVLNAEMIDYPSARFRDVYVSEGVDKSVSFCGYVNSKNRAGGYTGWRSMLIMDDSLTIDEGEKDWLAGEICKSAKDHGKMGKTDVSALLAYR